eukprot:COSAG02_NODE_4091_length_5797_cov_127.687434_4_plen_45_part_00
MPTQTNLALVGAAPVATPQKSSIYGAMKAALVACGTLAGVLTLC